MKFIPATDVPIAPRYVQVLQLAELKFVECINSVETFTREEFYNQFGPGSTFPRVKYEDRLLGGCTETVQYLREQNLV